MEIKIRKRQAHNGGNRLMLNFNDDGRRSIEILDLYVFTNPSNQEEREHNLLIAKMADEIKSNRCIR